MSVGYPARHQRDLRSRAARRLHREAKKVDAGPGAQRGRRGVRQAFCAALAELGRRRPDAGGCRGHRAPGLARLAAYRSTVGAAASNRHAAHAKPARSPPRRLAAAAAAPAPASAPPRSARRPSVSVSALLRSHAADTGDAAAFRRLLSLWGTAMVNDTTPAARPQKAGLACLEQRGSWAQVRAPQSAGHTDPDRRSGTAAPRRAVRAWISSRARWIWESTACACRSTSCPAIGSASSPSSGSPRPRARGCCRSACTAMRCDGCGAA